jgi:hypothetical protein
MYTQALLCFSAFSIFSNVTRNLRDADKINDVAYDAFVRGRQGWIIERLLSYLTFLRMEH